MQRELVRHNLNYEKTLEYVSDQLNCSYALSTELLNSLDFKEGQFFTLLPADADLERVYDFFGGCILPQNKTHEYINELGKKSSYTWIPTLKEEIGYYILEKLKNEEHLCCIFEDVVHRIGDTHLEFFHQFGFLYLTQIYYFLNRENASHETIVEAIHQINSLWHLVLILTKIESPIAVGKEVALKDIRELCKKMQLMVVGAYDGEGFVFWQSNN